MNQSRKYHGNLVDIFNEEIFSAEITVEDERIIFIERSAAMTGSFILPGFIDSHIHIESSMLTPQHFGRIALSHGTVATVSDPHEIANVLGLEGILYMIENASESDLKFFFGAPSCVPATKFETSGAEISASDIDSLFKNYKLYFLSELMNYPGVINRDEEVLRKIDIAKKYYKKIDGHAPGLTGKDLQIYIDAGIDTDHECSNLNEAIEKIERGMRILIREGSAAKNFNALWPLIDKFPDKVFLCTDDLHPDDLIDGHINRLLRMGVKKGINLFNLIRTVTVNPVNHYKLNVGLLRVGDKADFIRVDDLKSFNVSETYINGKIVFERSLGLKEIKTQRIISKFNATKVSADSLILPPNQGKVKVISINDGELFTDSFLTELSGVNDLNSDIKKDILKLVVINRYQSEPAAVAFIHNFNLKEGAMASSIAHDSHNIIAVGVTNTEIADCINWIISNKGGVAINNGKEITGIPLPVAGIMSDKSAEEVSEKYLKLNKQAKSLGCKLKSPFMSLSFMSLLVIPQLKLSNMGLFDGNTFAFTSLYEN